MTEFARKARKLPLLRGSDLFGILGATLLIACIWLLASYVFNVPSYLLPTPAAVATEAANFRGRLAVDFLVTGGEALVGFTVSAALSMLIAIEMNVHRVTEKFVMPILVVLKSIPIVALAPLVGYWFGYGYMGKIFVASLISFFPLVVNAASGMREVRQEQIDFFRVMGASRWDEVIRLRLPRAMPSIFSAMRIAAPLAVVGAVFAEMLGAKHGLGYTIAVSSMTLDMAVNFAAILASALLGITMFYAILICERYYLRLYRLSPRDEW